MMIGKEGMRIECVPARGKDLRTDHDHRLLPDLVLKGDVQFQLLLDCSLFFIFMLLVICVLRYVFLVVPHFYQVPIEHKYVEKPTLIPKRHIFIFILGFLVFSLFLCPLFWMTVSLMLRKKKEKKKTKWDEGSASSRFSTCTVWKYRSYIKLMSQILRFFSRRTSGFDMAPPAATVIPGAPIPGMNLAC